MQEEMVCSGMRDGELGDPATARDRLIPGSDLAMLLEEIKIGVENVSWQAYFAWMAGKEPNGHLAVVVGAVTVFETTSWILPIKLC